MMSFIVGGVLLVIAFILYMWREKRSFDRTSSGGVEQYEDYSSVWKARILELGAWILMWIFLAYGLVGLLGGFMGFEFWN